MSSYENNFDTTTTHLPKRDLMPAMINGARHRCPKCGEGALYERYLKVTHQCDACGEDLSHHRADDAPAYFTISIVGKIIVGLFVAIELAYEPPYWLHALIWIPLLLIMSLLALPRIKGVIVALQWANYMHGFDPEFKEGADIEIAPADKLAAQRPS